MAARHRPWLPWVSVIFAILLALLPLPQELAPLRPYWLALVVAYWMLESPDHTGLGFAFFAGLFADLAHGALLGDQAFRMVVLAFILDRFRTRLRFFPAWQQSLAILALLINDRIIAALVHMLVGAPQWPARYWLAPIVGALLWAPLHLMLEALRQRRGSRS